MLASRFLLGVIGLNSNLRPMSTGEILDRTFSLYRNNFLVFAGIAILPASLALVLQLVGIVTHATVRTPGRTPGEAQLIAIGFELLVIFIASVVGGSIASGASVYAVYYLHLGKPATIASSYKNVLAAWFRVISAAVLVFVALVVISAIVTVGLIFAVFSPILKMANSSNTPVIAGFAVFGIAAVIFLLWLYLSAWLAFVIPALLLDKNSILRAFRRSHRLSKGSRGRIFLVLLLTLVLTFAFTWAMRIPAYMIFDRWRQEIPLQLWNNLAQFISAVIAGPIATIAIALFYVDQRIRKEAFDLHLMLQSIEEGASGPAGAV